MNPLRKIASAAGKYLTRLSGEGVEINTVYTDEHYREPTGDDPNRRGIQVYSLSDLVTNTGKEKDGQRVSVKSEQKYFYLNIIERNQIFRLCAPVFGVVSSRMNRMSALEFNVVPVRSEEDRIADDYKSKYQVFKELEKEMDFKNLMVKAKIYGYLAGDLPGLKPDLSNFEGCLMRWKKDIQNTHISKGEQIKDWLLEPNQGVIWSDYVKKWVYDLMIHGAASTYKQSEKGVVSNFDLLIGGSVYKLKNPYFSGVDAYIQIVSGYEPQVFYGNEISYCQYLPTSVLSYGMIPLEALINKIAETLLFDKLMADRADGTQVPSKMVVVTDNSNPFKDFDKEQQDMNIDTDEQKRIEEKINTPIKGGVMTFSGNHASIVDLSRADTLEVQNVRQKDIREDVALVFNMSNMEVNLTGSGDTSGRATSETQQEIEQGKGIAPLVKLLERHITKDIITSRYGYGYKLEIQQQKNAIEEKELDEKMLRTGEMTKNEIREKYNKTPFDGDEYNLPDDSAPLERGNDINNPLFSKMVQ